MTAPSPIRTVVVDDHPMLRDGTVAYLEGLPDIDVVGIADDGHQALEKVQETNPDVVLLDLRLPDMNGVDVARQLLALMPDLAIIIITGYSYLAYQSHLSQMGINLILDKTASGTEIAGAVRQAAAQRAAQAPTSPSAGHRGYPLTLREGQVLEMLAEGRHNYEAAAELGVSSKTVEFHITNLMAKLGARSRMDAVLIAQDLGLIDLNRVPSGAGRVTAAPTRRGTGSQAGSEDG